MQGRDLAQFVVDFTWYLRNLLMVQSSGDLTDLVEASAERLEVMRQEASAIDASVLMPVYPDFLRSFRSGALFNTEACVGRGGIDQALPSGHGTKSGCCLE